jgi:hypothetical protein
LRGGYGHGQRRLRGQNHHPPRAPLRAMEWWRLRSLLLSVLLFLILTAKLGGGVSLYAQDGYQFALYSAFMRNGIQGDIGFRSVW